MMKFVVVLNSRADLPAQINAAGHLCLGLHNRITESDLLLRAFKDASGAVVSVLTDHPLIVLSARSGEHLREAHANALNEGVACSAFFECMRTGEPVDQEAEIMAKPVVDQEYLAIALFGPADTLKPLTRRFSLLRAPAGAIPQ